MGVTIWENKGRLYLSIYSNGRRWRESTGLKVCDNKTQNKDIMKLANVLRSKKEAELVDLAEGLVEPESTKASLYNGVKELAEFQGNTVGAYKVLPYIERFDGDVKLRAITPNWFENFQKKMEMDSGLVAVTAEKYCTYVRQVLKKAVRDGILYKDPSASIKHIRVPQKKKETLNIEEIKLLVTTDPPGAGGFGSEVKKGFLLSLCTGLRFSDIKSLTWQDVDFDKKIIFKRMQKTKTLVSVPLKEDAYRLLYDGVNHDSSEFVFSWLNSSKSNSNHYIKNGH